jgi:hypothetical protein
MRKHQDVGGVFFRQLSGGTANGELIAVVRNNVG